MRISITQSRGRPQAAFTLVEVILAIVIALGILVVLLYFYQQATSFRTQILQETERIAAARLLMDRITGELRTAQAAPGFGQGFTGGSNSIEFVRAEVPSFSAWMGGALGRSAFPVSDLKLVRYRLESADGTNVAGLLRTEEPLVPENQSGRLIDDPDLEATNVVSQTAFNPVLEEIRFLQFRYWSGTNWLDTWNSSAFPAGVEVSLGPEAQTNETGTAESPVEVFRRVVFLAASAATRPASGTIAAKTGTDATDSEEAP